MSKQRKFNDDEKENIQKIEIALEYELEVESKSNEELSKFAQFPQLVEVIELAKAKRIAEPDSMLDLTPWLFWSPLEEWFHANNTKACKLIFKFSAAIKGFPDEES
jgi:hypothetical protein